MRAILLEACSPAGQVHQQRFRHPPGTKPPWVELMAGTVHQVAVRSGVWIRELIKCHGGTWEHG